MTCSASRPGSTAASGRVHGRRRQGDEPDDDGAEPDGGAAAARRHGAMEGERQRDDAGGDAVKAAVVAEEEEAADPVAMRGMAEERGERPGQERRRRQAVGGGVFVGGTRRERGDLGQRQQLDRRGGDADDGGGGDPAPGGGTPAVAAAAEQRRNGLHPERVEAELQIARAKLERGQRRERGGGAPRRGRVKEAADGHERDRNQREDRNKITIIEINGEDRVEHVDGGAERRGGARASTIEGQGVEADAGEKQVKPELDGAAGHQRQQERGPRQR